MTRVKPIADSEALGCFVRERRQALGLSQQALSWHTRWAQGNLSRLERGTYGMPSVDTLSRLAANLNVTLRDLLCAAGYDVDGEAQQ